MAVKIQQSGSLQMFNLTPMIDCVFLLLIFFLVATRFAEEERELDVQLPVASEAKPLVAKPQSVFVNIDQHGHYVVANRQVSAQQLHDVLRQAAINNPGRVSVRIRGDKRSALDSSVQVFNICHRVGIRDYDIQTKD
ncbi:MAG: biopolymer transporter ExbD [Pirellulales bacterium]